LEHETSSPNLRFVSKSNDRTVVVTGASTGIGAACVRHLAEHGYRVFATVRKESDAEGISAFDHPRLSPLMLDVTVSDSIEAAVKKVEAEVGGAGLSGLVNNAGISVDVPLEFVGLDALRRQIEVNSIAPVAVTQAFLPLLRRATGRIVNVSSINGRVATPFSGPYCMSKFALEAFSDCLRQEIAPWGMHVCVVEPGAIDTAIWEKDREDDWSIDASDEELALYSDAFRAFRRFSARNAAGAISCDAVSRAIFNALDASSPRTRYLVGTDAKVYGWLASVSPDRVLDFVTRKLMR
jgi:NAD(P)-dependent dehydrogenase (short-subunit alcohol dehydrogenase family)